MNNSQDGAGESAKVIVRDMTIKNKRGFHARPASLVAKIAFNFDGDITIEKDGTVVTAKSVMGLLSLEAGKGTRIRITASGDGAEKAVSDIEQVLKQTFEEL